MTSGSIPQPEGLDSTALDAATPTVPDVGPGGVLAPGLRLGRYTIVRKVGHGGMGYVYAARDRQLGRQVALKILHAEHDARAADAVVREAKALARLDDPHVVQVYDAGEIDGHVFIAMQLVDGEDLAVVLSRRSPSAAQILGWFADAGRGLAAAHAAGLIHRDFKPSNVLLDRNGRIAVSDFGIACDVSEAYGPGARGVLLGTPAYMSPEQHGMQPATEVSDQFSFCIALWEALFRRHPFIDGDPSAMSPLAIGDHIIDSPLFSPPPGVRVPRGLVDVLTRGLAREPEQRWPSMKALIGALSPVRLQRRIWPYVAVAGVLAGGGASAAVALLGRGAPPDSCATVAARRAAAAWSAEHRKTIHDRFVATGRPFAELANRTAGAAIDGYVTRWSQLASDACIGERAAAGAPPELLVRRRACLDARLDGLRATVAAISTGVTPELVDRAGQLADTLPDLAECSDSAPDAPPAAQTAAVAKLEVDLGTATVHLISGELAHAQVEAAAVVAAADALGLPDRQARAHALAGKVARVLYLPGAEEELRRAAQIALAHGFDRMAAKALADAASAVSGDHADTVLASIAPFARATAARTQDRRLEVTAEIAIARGLLRTKHWNAGAAACEKAYAAAQEITDAAIVEQAETCVIEGRMALDKYSTLDEILRRRIEIAQRDNGPESPQLADYLSIHAEVDVSRGKLADARVDAERGLAIYRKLYAPNHFKIAHGLIMLANIADAEGNTAELDRLYQQALAIVDQSTPEEVDAYWTLHVAMAMKGAHEGKAHFAEAFDHLDKAAAAIRAHIGEDAVELALVLLDYGQVKAEVDLDGGLAMLAHGRDILERHHDKRASHAETTLLIVAIHHARYADAVTYGEAALASFDADTPPLHVALAKWYLADALARTGGDRKRAHQLARESRDIYAKLGAGYQGEVKRVDDWLATH